MALGRWPKRHVRNAADHIPATAIPEPVLIDHPFRYQVYNEPQRSGYKVRGILMSGT